jgi:hypothetical protein
MRTKNSRDLRGFEIDENAYCAGAAGRRVTVSVGDEKLVSAARVISSCVLPRTRRLIS